MAKGVQPITTASLATSKISGTVPGVGKQKAPKPNTKMMASLFGKKPMKQAIQSSPTKTAAL